LSKNEQAVQAEAFFDKKALGEEASRGLQTTPEITKALSARFHFVLRKSGGLGIPLAKKGTDVGFVGITNFECNSYPVIRKESPTTFDYLLLDLKEDAQGNFRNLRTYSLLAGEWSTTVYRRVLIERFVELKGDLNKLEPADRDFAQNSKLIYDFTVAGMTGKFAEMNGIYSQLSESLAKKPWLRKLRLQFVSADKNLRQAELANLEPDAQQSVSIALLTLNPSLDAGHLNAASTKIKLID